MRPSRRSIWTAAAGVALGTSVAMTAVASPLIQYELRFSDGTHTKLAAPGTYQTELWIHLRGTDAFHSNERHASSYITVVSNQFNGGALASGGVTSGEVVEPFDFSKPVGARDGGPNDINGDGIQDWGGTEDNIATSSYMLAIHSSPIGEQGGLFYGEAVGTGWKFHLANFEITVGTVGTNIDAKTTFTYAKPIATTSGQILLTHYAVFRVDSSSNQTLNNDNFNTVHPDAPIGITFVIPEPGALSMVGLGAAGLLARRRRA